MADFAPAQIAFDYENADDVEQIKRSVTTLLSIRAGSQPMDRNFGISFDFMGSPLDVAKNLYALEVEEKIERYIPEAEIKNMEFSYDETEGRIIPRLVICRREEET